MNSTISEEDAILSTLSPAMRRALLTAAPADPDTERLFITISRDVTIGTVVSLIGRGLVEHAANTRTRDHELTNRGLCILHALKALQERGQAGTERPSGLNRRQRERVNLAFSAATSALNEARAQGRLSMAYSYSIAAALESLADSGDTSPATLRVIASAFREV